MAESEELWISHVKLKGMCFTGYISVMAGWIVEVYGLLGFLLINSLSKC